MRVICVLLFLLTLASTVVSASDSEHIDISVHGLTVKFNGEISSTSSAEIIKMLTSKKFDTLEINSYGGNARAALTLAWHIKEKNINILVDKYCLSSCANYLFLAANNKTLRSGAILGFHGGIAGAPAPLLKLDDLEKIDGLTEQYRNNEALRALNKSIEEIYKNDVKFYSEIEFNPEFLQLSWRKTAGKDSKSPFHLKCRSTENDVECQGFSAGENHFFFPSEATLLKFGVKKINSYPYPTTKTELNAQFEKRTSIQHIVVVGDF
jgi:hypothetical protein